jgi:hypothetical protein
MTFTLPMPKNIWMPNLCGHSRIGSKFTDRWLYTALRKRLDKTCNMSKQLPRTSSALTKLPESTLFSSPLYGQGRESTFPDRNGDKSPFTFTNSQNCAPPCHPFFRRPTIKKTIDKVSTECSSKCYFLVRLTHASFGTSGSFPETQMTNCRYKKTCNNGFWSLQFVSFFT